MRLSQGLSKEEKQSLLLMTVKSKFISPGDSGFYCTCNERDPITQRFFKPLLDSIFRKAEESDKSSDPREKMYICTSKQNCVCFQGVHEAPGV